MDTDRPLTPLLAPRTGPVRPRALWAAAALLATLALPAMALAQDAPADPPEAADDAPAASAESSDDDAGDADAGDDGMDLDALRTTQMCIDGEIASRLAIKRQRRQAVDRLFVKQARHELTAMGGYYQSDLFSGTYTVGGAYTYHLTETVAVEFGATYTHANADIIRSVEDGRATVIDDDFDRVILAESLLLWAPVYGKLRMGGTVMRFDLNAGIGVGVVDAATSRGAAGVAGVGMKLFIGQALAFRIDARNHVFQQELLDRGFLVNDVSITSGLSLFLPFRN
ncbi:outer membrane beta-barrel domain-containing protein [Haliangium sp.]|uniref:outer membrane beta-barrel domain-containing protein n=1 Tax=Haliangium sp. TaxID=2663208 RepID=UPI003D09C65D